MGDETMSTNTTTLRLESAQHVRGGLAAILAAILLAAAAAVALNSGPPVGTAPAAASDAEVEKALIDVRAGERALRGVGVPTSEYLGEFHAAEREMR